MGREAVEGTTTTGAVTDQADLNVTGPYEGLHAGDRLTQLKEELGELATKIDPVKLGAIALQARIARDASLGSTEDQIPERELIAREEARAHLIIDQIALRVELERSVGRNFAIIMNVNTSDYTTGTSTTYGLLMPQWLKGAALSVYEYAESTGLSPTLEYWDDVRGKFTGHNIVVHFDVDPTEAASVDSFSDLVISQIPIRTGIEAAAGRRHAVVLSFDEPQGTVSPGTLQPEQLEGDAKAVFRFCKKEGLNPGLEYWEAADGSFSGYNIVVFWEYQKDSTASAK